MKLFPLFLFLAGGCTALRPLPGGHPPALGKVERKSDGSYHYMNQNEAIAFCAGKGMHLPGMREYAEYAAGLGAGGVHETAFPDHPYAAPEVIAEREREGRDGFVVVYRENALGAMLVDFYYQRYGYRRPEGELGTFWFWTSSQAPRDSGLAIAFDSKEGVAHYGFYHFNYYLVRCAEGR